MVDYDNTNRGVAFKNRDKDEDHPKWPDYKGELDVEGYKFWLSVWVKVAANGNKYFTVSVKAKEPRPKQKPELNDQIPF